MRHADAEALIAAAGGDYAYELVNPFAYEAPIAPHLAAAEANRPISLAKIANAYAELARNADVVIVEGAGGWRVPLDERSTLAAIPQQLGLDIILVVGLRLGCLSHALLSAEAILADGCRLLGWVANGVVASDPWSLPQAGDTARALGGAITRYLALAGRSSRCRGACGQP